MVNPGEASEFDQAIEHLDSFGLALNGLISEVLRAKGLAVHSVDYRVKGWESATRKLSRADDKYSGYGDLKDLLGIRVITYFEDDVDKVARFLNPEFAIDKQNSVDKRTLLDPDRFGYMSLHYVAQLNKRRSGLVEYQRFDGLCFELQIRSILQHAWAEIEHDLGYKAERSVPRDVRRRFSRLAGLLELADSEFIQLRADLNRYERKVESAIKTKPETLELDQSTMTAYLQNDPLTRRLDKEIASRFPSDLDSKADPAYAGKLVNDLGKLGIRDIQTVRALMSARRKHILKFAEEWLGARDLPPNYHRDTPLQRGISLFYLQYTLIATNEQAMQVWAERRSEDPKTATPFSQRVLATWEQVVEHVGDLPGAGQDLGAVSGVAEGDAS
jgi:putative GTP pyrophosphokinase